MSEALKTSVYVGIALVLAVIAWAARPRTTPPSGDDRVNQALFEFDDPNKVQSMEIVRYDEELGEIHKFEVAKNSQSGLWTIPSHSDYPADAEDQVRDAATIFVGLNVLGLVTEDASEHELFGVLEPDETKLTPGDKGVGLLVRFENEDGKSYPLIVGKEVKAAEGHRFVRIPNQDPVYDVEFDPEKLSTKFEDWIEKDLLDLNTWDVENVRIKDYSLVEALQGTLLEPRFELAARWNSDDSKWEPEEFLTYRGREAVPTELLATEELNKQNLDDLKYALDDLEIVDVRRKPKGLSGDLTAGSEFMDDRASQQSLASRGFIPHSLGAGKYELLAANGEVHIGMKDGYEYMLRFGNVAGTGEGADEGTLNRYLLVTARLDESKLQVPEPPEGLDEAKAKEVEEALNKPAESEDAENNGIADAEDNNAEPAEEKPSNEASPAESTDVPAEADSSDADDSSEAEASTSEGEEKPADAVEETEKPVADVSEDPADADDKPADGASDADSESEESERERLAKDYKRELDEWNEKKTKAEQKVRELNARFADWYYVISEDVYKKIHLNRSELIQETEEAKEEGFGLDAFRKLEEDGVEGSDEDDEDSSDN